jgi:hypothetical protein
MAYIGYFKIIKIMRESYFANNFPQILEHTWCLVKKSQDKINLIGGNKNETAEHVNPVLDMDEQIISDTKDEY